MTDPFSQNISEKLEQLLYSLQQDTHGTSFFSEDSVGGGLTITSVDVLELLAGNQAIMDRFEKEIEQRFDRLGKRILSHWLENTDKKIRDSLIELAQIAVSMVSEGNERKVTFQQVQESVEKGNFAQDFEGLIAGSVDGLLAVALKKTKTRSTETERSKQEVQRFTASRGQQQAQLAEDIAKGKRYQ